MAGLLFEIGTNKLIIDEKQIIDETQKQKVDKIIAKRHLEVVSEKAEENLHTEMQYHLLKIGQALGYDVIAAANDRSKSFVGNKFSFFCLSCLPEMKIDKETLNTINLIDVLWLQKDTNQIISAFEVEKSTSIYSGILRLTDLAISFPENLKSLFLVTPNKREKEVIFQLKRPSIQRENLYMQYILFEDLRQHYEAICKFGEDYSVMLKIAKTA